MNEGPGSRPRRLFVAGSTGATGRVLVARAHALGIPVMAHQRPRPGRSSGEGVVVADLADPAATRGAVAGATTIVQLIGTMRHRFADGDTYERSDIETTRALVEAARENGADHVVLLSSVLAGMGVGAYLAAKLAAERVVIESGIPYTIVRPSALQGEGRPVPEFLFPLSAALGLWRVRPIRIADLVDAILLCALERGPLGAVLEGRPIFERVLEARRRWAG